MISAVSRILEIKQTPKIEISKCFWLMPYARYKSVHLSYVWRTALGKYPVCIRA